MTEPEWRLVVGFPAYEVSSDGQVRRRLPGGGAVVGRILKQSLKGRPPSYPFVNLGRGHQPFVHVLVANAFLGPKPSPKHQCAHNDGNSQNPRADNLRWDTPAGNQRDRVRHNTHVRGERSHYAKLTQAQVDEIRNTLHKRPGRRRFGIGVLAAAAEKYGVTAGAVRLALNHKTWKGLEE